jgi:hypothetical protein
MKYIVGAVVAILAILFIRNMSIKSPEGVYADPNGAMILSFEKNGKLTIGARAGSTIMINNRPWEGPRSNQVTITRWKRTGSKIYIDMPGEERPLPAFEIDGDDLIFDNLRLQRVR